MTSGAGSSDRTSLRTAIATYFGGIRGDWATARFLTDDTRDSLEEHYVVVKGEVAKLLKTKGVKNPRWFDRIKGEIPSTLQR